MSTVRNQVQIDASGRTLWRALTTAEIATQWWAEGARIDPREGGRIVLTQGEGEDAVQLRGVFHALKPTRSIEILWDDTGKSPEKGTRVHFLVGRDEGETRLHVVQSGGALVEDPEASTVLEQLWGVRLKALRDLLEASPGPA
jgi:uncharacterized protein YndB with AHSA1/START domain